MLSLVGTARKSPLLLASVATTACRHSHIGRTPVRYGKEVTFEHQPPTGPVGAFGAAGTLKVIGPLGNMSVAIQPFVSLDLQPTTNNEPVATITATGIQQHAKKNNATAAATSEDADFLLTVRVDDDTKKQQRAMWGTTRALIANAVNDVTEGYRLPLRMVGVGYRASLEQDGRVLGLKLGYSHPIEMPLPQGVTASVPNPTRIVLSGVDRQLVSQFAAAIRRWRIPEPYKQKGIFVGDETIRKKDIKKSKK
ncbi:putative ribosomal protein L6 [Syncephalis plumigaleata]|nr:putative ribosomal protein L6 [Syncephalis plumigaleata]